MSDYVRKYLQEFARFAEGVEATGEGGRRLQAPEAMAAAAELVLSKAASGGKLIFIGNGGSAAIASHMATDYCKNGGIPAMAFNDASMLTCLSNDLGYEHVFEKPISMFARRGDLLFAISSSGRSPNILLGVEAARARGSAVVTLSGFDADNPLRGMGELNLWVPSHRYGPVEVIHHALCHAILDTVMELRGRRAGGERP